MVVITWKYFFFLKQDRKRGGGGPDLSALRGCWLSEQLCWGTVNRGEAARCGQVKPWFNLVGEQEQIHLGGKGLLSTGQEQR